MTTKGLDAYGSIAVAHLAGIDFVGRYVSQTTGKCIVRSEYQSYMAAKKSVGLFYEDNPKDGFGGATTGTAKGKIAKAILQQIGWQAGRPVHFTFDFNAGAFPSSYSTFYDCAAAFAAEIGAPPAVYCDAWLGAYMHTKGVQYIWGFGEGTNSVDGPWAPARVWQGPSYEANWGQSVDPDTSLAADFGQSPWEVRVHTDVTLNPGQGIQVTDIPVDQVDSVTLRHPQATWNKIVVGFTEEANGMAAVYCDRDPANVAVVLRVAETVA